MWCNILLLVLSSLNLVSFVTIVSVVVEYHCFYIFNVVFLKDELRVCGFIGNVGSTPSRINCANVISKLLIVTAK